MSDDNDPDHSKVKALEDKIKTLRPQNDDFSEKGAEEKLKRADDANDGIRAGVELVVPAALGCFFGLQLDKWLDTAPLFLIILLLLGISAGFMNVYRITQSLDKPKDKTQDKSQDESGEKSAQKQEDNKN